MWELFQMMLRSIREKTNSVNARDRFWNGKIVKTIIWLEIHLGISALVKKKQVMIKFDINVLCIEYENYICLKSIQIKIYRKV